MRTLIFLSILTTIISESIVFAGIPSRKTGTFNIDKNKNDDTSKIVFIAKKPILNQISSYPAHDLYNIWDTTVIHPYYPDNYFTNDEIILTLEGGDDHFTMPWKGIVTSSYGWRHGRPHTGTDIDLETGDTVVAAFSGKVRLARVAGGYGNCVIIRHPNGLETVYGHLSKILVKSGDEICSGEVLGLGGNTGHSFGSHLHFEMRYLGKSINTERFINYKSWGLKQNEFVVKKSDFVMSKPAYIAKISKLHRGKHAHNFSKKNNRNKKNTSNKYAPNKKNKTNNLVHKHKSSNKKAISSSKIKHKKARRA